VGAAVVAAGGAVAVAAVAGAERTEEDLVMNGSTCIRMGLLVVLLAGLAPVSRAQDPPTARASKLDPAWQRVAQSNAKFLTKDQQALLHDLAFAAAAAELCPGFRVDRDAFVKAFEAFKTPEYMKLPPDKKRRLEYRLMVNFGALVALYHAEGLLHPKEACRLAEEKRAAGPGRYWVQPAAATSGP
jgi:hypothetical protein